jgi:hypothetical protein
LGARPISGALFLCAPFTSPAAAAFERDMTVLKTGAFVPIGGNLLGPENETPSSSRAAFLNSRRDFFVVARGGAPKHENAIKPRSRKR